MRFLLDADVDADCRRALIDAGHDAWTVGDAGRHIAHDVDQVIYADDQGAVFVTHDRELVVSRRERPIGRIIRLRCREWHAAQLLQDGLARPGTIELLERNANLIVSMSRLASGEVRVSGWWGTETS